MPERSCAGCSACCTLMAVAELSKKALARCAYQEYPIQIRLSGTWNPPSSNPIEDIRAAEMARQEEVPPKGGCAIYEQRPQSCRDFECYWRIGYMTENERPDKLGVMLVPYEVEDLESGDRKIGIRALEVYEGGFNRARALLAKLAEKGPILLQLRAGSDFENYLFDGETLSPWPTEIRKDVVH